MAEQNLSRRNFALFELLKIPGRSRPDVFDPPFFNEFHSHMAALP